MPTVIPHLIQKVFQSSLVLENYEHGNYPRGEVPIPVCRAPIKSNAYLCVLQVKFSSHTEKCQPLYYIGIFQCQVVSQTMMLIAVESLSHNSCEPACSLTNVIQETPLRTTEDCLPKL